MMLTDCRFTGGRTVVSNEYATILVISATLVWWERVICDRMYTENNCISPICITQEIPEKITGSPFISSAYSKFHSSGKGNHKYTDSLFSSHASHHFHSHSLSNRNDVWIFNCTFSFLRTGYYGGCLFVNISQAQAGRFLICDIVLCQFYHGSSYYDGGLIYLEVHSLKHVTFPLAKDPTYTPSPNRTSIWYPSETESEAEPEPVEIFWYDPFPYNYFGIGNGRLDPPLFSPGATFEDPITMLPTQGTDGYDAPEQLYGQHMIIHIDTDISFPFNPVLHDIGALLDFENVDIFRTSFRFDAPEYGMVAKHSIGRTIAFLVELMPIWDMWTFYCGDPTLPPRPEDIDEDGTVPHDCLAPTTACPTLTAIVRLVNGDSFLAAIMGTGAEICEPTEYIYDLLTTVEVITVQRPRGVLFVTSSPETGQTARIIALANGGMPQFFHVQFVFRRFTEDDTSPALFEIHYWLFLKDCQFTKYEADYPVSSGMPDYNGPLSAYWTRITKYRSLIWVSGNGVLKMDRVVVSNISLEAPDSSLVLVEQGRSAWEKQGEYDLEIARCQFTHIWSTGNGSVFHVQAGECRLSLYYECTFRYTVAGLHGGCIYHRCPTLAHIHFTNWGMGFVALHNSVGARCSLSSIYDDVDYCGDNSYDGNGGGGDDAGLLCPSPLPVFLGKFVLISLTDTSVRTPTFPTVSFFDLTLRGLNMPFLDLNRSHVEGYGKEESDCSSNGRDSGRDGSDYRSDNGNAGSRGDNNHNSGHDENDDDDDSSNSSSGRKNAGNSSSSRSITMTKTKSKTVTDANQQRCYVPEVYTIADILGPQTLPTIDCGVINAKTEAGADMCRLTGGRGCDAVCTVVIDRNSAVHAKTCVAVDGLSEGGGGNGTKSAAATVMAVNGSKGILIRVFVVLVVVVKMVVLMIG